MLKRAVSITLGILFLLGAFNLVLAQPQIKKGLISGPEPQISEEAVEKPTAEIRTKVDRVIVDAPRIREFFITPNYWMQGQAGTAIIRWQVEPVPGGSPVDSITISGPETSHSSRDLTGQCNANILSYAYPTSLRYTLTAANTAGRISTREINFEVKSPVEIREQISFAGVSNEPAQFPDGTSYTVIFRINNRSGIRLSGVRMQIGFSNFIPWAITASSGEIPTRKELRGQIINPGINEYRFTDTLSAIDGSWRVGHMRGQYFLNIYYGDFLMLCCPVPILDILVSQIEPQRLFRI
jgi:hypothetical protein